MYSVGCENEEFVAPTEGEIGNLAQYRSERDRKTWGGVVFSKWRVPVNLTKKWPDEFFGPKRNTPFCLFSIRYSVITD